MAERQDLRQQYQSQQEYNIQHDLDRLKEDVFRLRSDISELAQKLIEIGRSETRVTKDRLFEGSYQAFDRTRERGRKTADVMGQKVEEKPLMSLFTAFIIGIFLGSLGRLLNR